MIEKRSCMTGPGRSPGKGETQGREISRERKSPGREKFREKRSPGREKPREGEAPGGRSSAVQCRPGPGISPAASALVCRPRPPRVGTVTRVPPYPQASAPLGPHEERSLRWEHLNKPSNRRSWHQSMTVRGDISSLPLPPFICVWAKKT